MGTNGADELLNDVGWKIIGISQIFVRMLNQPKMHFAPHDASYINLRRCWIRSCNMFRRFFYSSPVLYRIQLLTSGLKLFDHAAGDPSEQSPVPHDVLPTRMCWPFSSEPEHINVHPDTRFVVLFNSLLSKNNRKPFIINGPPESPIHEPTKGKTLLARCWGHWSGGLKIDGLIQDSSTGFGEFVGSGPRRISYFQPEYVSV